MAWLTRGGEVLASAEVAETRAERRRGLVGRDGVDGVMVMKTRSVHTFGMRFPLDVAFCDEDGRVIRIITMKKNRVSMPVWKSAMVIEAPQGTFHDWSLAAGDQLEIR